MDAGQIISSWGWCPILIAGFLCLAGMVEAQLPPKVEGDKAVVAYGIAIRAACVVLLILMILFGFGIAEVERASVWERIGIMSLLVVPVAVVSLETLGRKITVTADSITRTYFGGIRFERKIDLVTRVTYSRTLKMFVVRFEGGRRLWISTAMRGSFHFGYGLEQKLATTPPA